MILCADRSIPYTVDLKHFFPVFTSLTIIKAYTSQAGHNTTAPKKRHHPHMVGFVRWTGVMMTTTNCNATA